MTLNEMSKIANDYTDENIATGMLHSFANGAISRVNIELKSKLPLIDNVETYTALDDDWINAIVIPFMCWSIKMNDSSLNEAQIYLFQFQEGLREIKKNKYLAIDEAYRGDSFQTKFVMDNAYIKPKVYNPYAGD